MKKSLLGLALCVLATSSAQADGVLTQHIGFGVSDTYDAAGFDRNGVHKDTGTSVDADGYGPEGNQAPQINAFSASPASGDAPLSATFTANVSDDVGTPTLNIDYGDGSSGSSMSHTYAAGDWTATLTATDEKGLASTATTVVNAVNAGPECHYNAFTHNWHQNNGGVGTLVIWWESTPVYENYSTGGANLSPLTTGGYTYTRGSLMAQAGSDARYEICRVAE